MKTKEELNALKEEVKNLNKKLAELSDNELQQVTGGVIPILFAEQPSRTASPHDTDFLP